MKTKFWISYLFAVLVMLGGVYFTTAQMSDVPLALSDTQMEQLSGTRIDWNCIRAHICSAIPCNNNNLVETVPGRATCSMCETEPNDTCYSLGYKCMTCRVRQYVDSCSGDYDFYDEEVIKCT